MKMKVLNTSNVEDAQVMMISSASYRGSEPFSGNFRTWDLDHCYRRDELTNKLFITVFCELDDVTDEDAILEFEVHDFVHHGCDGFDGEVISRITFSD